MHSKVSAHNSDDDSLIHVLKSWKQIFIPSYHCHNASYSNIQFSFVSVCVCGVHDCVGKTKIFLFSIDSTVVVVCLFTCKWKKNTKKFLFLDQHISCCCFFSPMKKILHIKNTCKKYTQNFFFFISFLFFFREGFYFHENLYFSRALFLLQ